METIQNGKKLKTAYVKQRYNYLGVLLIVILSFFPLSTYGNIMRFGITGILFVICVYKTRAKMQKELLHLIMLMMFSTIIPVITTLLVEHGANLSVWIHEVQRLCFYALLLYVVLNYRVPFKYIYVLCIIVLLVHTTIQTLQWLGYEWINEFIRQYYLQPGASDIHLLLASVEYGNLAFRSGSIYMNPNVYMVIPTTILVVVLQANIRRNSLINYLWMVITFFSLLLTGSRTTFFVALTVVGVYILKDKRSKYGRIVFVLLIVLSCLFFWDYLQENFRVFQLQKGMDSSFLVKTNGLKQYLKHASPFYYITGSLGSSLHVQIDAEWGYVFSYFGILGIVWYVKFLRLLSRNKKQLPFQTTGITVVISLIAMTATIVLCMPVFSFFCVIGLTKIEGE